MKIRKQNVGAALFLMFIIGVTVGTLVVPAVQGDPSPGGASPAMQLTLAMIIGIVVLMFAWAMIKEDGADRPLVRVIDWMDRVDRYFDRRKYR